MKIKALTSFHLLFISFLLLFQNCSNLTNSSPLLFKTKEVIFSSQLAGADMSWSASSPIENHFSLNPYKHIKRWMDQSPSLIPLYPGMIYSTNHPDIDHSGLLINTPKGPRIHFAEESFLSTIEEDALSLSSDEYSILLEISQVYFPLEDPKKLRLLSLTPSSEEEQAGALFLDLVNTNENIQLVASHSTSEGNNVLKVQVISPSDLINGLGIAVHWSSEANSINVAVNGELSSEPLIINGNPMRLGYVRRTLSVRSPTEDRNGHFNLAELGLFKKELKPLELQEYSLGLYKTYELHQSSFISSLNGLYLNETPIEYNQIITLFQKNIGMNTCFTCHTEFSSRQELIGATTGNELWIIPGAPTQSLLIKSLRHQNDAQAMPKGGGQMAEKDIQLIEKWIIQGAN